MNIVQIIGIQDTSIKKKLETILPNSFAPLLRAKIPQLARERADKTKGKRPIPVRTQDFRKIK